MRIIDELKRRNVIRVAGLYLVGAWLIVQVASTLLPLFEAPAWIARTIVLVLAIGFVPALALSWIFELTPRGIVRDADADRTTAHVAQRAHRIDRLIIAVLICGLAYLALDKFVLPRHQQAARDASAQAVVAPPTSVAPSAKSIAVLPFVDLSPGHDQEYFSDGMAEELLNALARVRDLKVAARTASFRYRGRNDSVQTIGEELGVGHVLEGSVRKQGERVRITAQLIQTADGFDQWSQTYDGDLNDVFELQERIARAITQELKAILEGDQQRRLVPVATTDTQAYALFLQANAIYNRRDFDHFADAIAALEQALRLDPKFARAQARLAAVHVVWDDRAAPYLQLAETNARKAIELDGSLAEPWAVLGRSYGEQRRFLEAHAAYDEALRREPDDALTNYWYGAYLLMTGYTRAGRARLDRALVLDPDQPNAELWRGLELSYAGDQEAAQRSVQRSADMGLSFAAYGLAEVARARGDYARAIAAIGSRVEVRMARCGTSAEDARRVLAAAHGGDAAAHADALAIIERCLAQPVQPTPFWPLKALMYLDQPAQLLAFAQPQLTTNETFLFEMLWSPYGKSARRLPAFAEFARRAGLVDAWEKYGPPDRCRRNAERDYVCE